MSSVISWVLGYALVAAVVAAVLVTVLAMLRGRRAPGSNVGWLLSLLIAPYLAVPVFWALSVRKLGDESERPRFPPLVGPAIEPAEVPFQRLGSPPLREGNSLRLLTSGTGAWAGLIDLIEGAEEVIEGTFFIVDDDASGAAFVEALTKRAEAGVTVRLLIDRIGGLRRPKAELARLTAAGGQVRFAAPLLAGPRRARLNLRNHRKMLVADTRRLFSGGMNVGIEYLGPDPDGPERWIDLATRIEGPVVGDHLALIRSDWAAALGEAPPPVPDLPPRAGKAPLQLVPSGPDVEDDPLADGLMSMIHRANRRAWLVTPYLVPTEGLIDAIALAARRGIDLRLIGPARSNHSLADLARAPILRTLQKTGARILMHPRMIHAKACLIDDVGLIGSANLDARSLLLNNESMLVLTGPEEVAELEAWTRTLMAACEEGIGDTGPIRGVIEDAARLATPLL